MTACSVTHIVYTLVQAISIKYLRAAFKFIMPSYCQWWHKILWTEYYLWHVDNINNFGLTLRVWYKSWKLFWWINYIIPWCSIIYRSGALNVYKKLLKRKGYCCSLLIFEWVHKFCMNEVCIWRRAETITRHSNQYHTTQCWPCWWSWEMWHAEVMMWCFVAWPPGLPHQTADRIQWTVECELWSIVLCFKTFSIQVIL